MPFHSADFHLGFNTASLASQFYNFYELNGASISPSGFSFDYGIKLCDFNYLGENKDLLRMLLSVPK